MSRCISSLVKHFNQVSHPSPLFLRNSVHQWSKKVIFLTVSSFLVSPCLASAGLHLFGLGRLGRQLTHFCSEFEQPTCLSLIRPNTVDNIRDVFRDARSIWKHESFLSTTMIIIATLNRCNDVLIKKNISIFAALFVERDHPVGIVNELSEKEGRKERR